MALTFEQAFGPNARLLRTHNQGLSNHPFMVSTSGWEQKNWNEDLGQHVKRYQFNGPDAGTWTFNPKTSAFDFTPRDGDGKVTKSISGAELGLADPAYQIAGLATLAGKNNDSWSNYALTHNDYGGGVGSQQSMLAGASALRGAIGDINAYDNKAGWGDKLLDVGDDFMARIPQTAALAATGYVGGMMYDPAMFGAAGAAEGATAAGIELTPEMAALLEQGVTGSKAAVDAYAASIANGVADLAPSLGAFAEAAGGYMAIPQYTPMGMSTAAPGMSMAGTTAAGDLIGYGMAGEIIGGASGLAGLVPQLVSSAAEAAGPLSTAVKTAKTVSQAKSISDMLESGDYLDAAKTVGGKLLENAPGIGTLASLLLDDGSGQTIGGQGGAGGAGGAGGSAAWMNQALPTINIPAYRSNVIQGDPYRYGMGAEQALYTDQSGNLPRAQNFGTSGGRPFGVQYNFEQAPAQSGGLASIQPSIQPSIQSSMQQPAKQALTQQDVTSYLSSKGLDLTPEGVQRGLTIYNSENPNSQLTQSDIGAAFGFSPEQSSAWMYEGQTKAPSVLEAQNWYKNQYAPTQTQSGGLASIQPSIQPTAQPAPAPAPVQAAAKPALTQQDVTAYLAANNLNLNPSGISTALAKFNGTIGNPADQYSINDVGAAFGYTPEQSRAWMQGQKFAEGGAVGGYNCGGLSQAFDREEEFEDARYVAGDGGGQDDDVDAMLSSGEYVFDADVVSALGDGNNEAGARILDELRAKIRQHKRAAPANKIPPKAKSIEQYLKEVR